MGLMQNVGRGRLLGVWVCDKRVGLSGLPLRAEGHSYAGIQNPVHRQIKREQNLRKTHPYDWEVVPSSF